MPYLRSQLEGSLPARFEIESLIGEGGMGVVYRCFDTKHKRHVAIKVLKPEVAGQVGWARFEHEIQVAASLQHPNIVPLHDSDRSGDILYAVMPLIEGSSLHRVLDLGGPLPVGQAVKFATEIAGAIAYAHGMGVVHRDIKPSNILISHGHALITDFGLAYVGAKSNMTETLDHVRLLGTPAYMSPEQHLGASLPQGDLFSLCVVLYEMLVGETPDARRARLILLGGAEDPGVPRIGPECPTVTPALDELLQRGLDPDPTKRFQNAEALVSALRAADTSWQSGHRIESRAFDELAIAVVPFRCQQPGREYFAAGLTNEVTSALVRCRGLRVPSVGSAHAVAEQIRVPQEIGRRLGVAALVAGSVHWYPEQISVTVELIQVFDGFLLWSQTLSAPHDAAFRLAESISTAVAAQLALPTDATYRMAAIPRGTDNIEAYNSYLKGRYEWNRRTPEGFNAAIAHYQSALRADPGYALAYSGLADTFVALAQFQHLPARQVISRARSAALRAVQLEAELAEALASLAHTTDMLGWNGFEAERLYRQAIERDPYYPNARAWLADVLSLLGRHEEAAVASQKALEMEPTSIPFAFQAANIRYRHRKFAEAERGYQEVIAAAPDYAVAYLFLSLTLCAQDRANEAVLVAEDGLEQAGSNIFTMVGHGYSLARSGRRAHATKVLDGLQRQRARKHVSAGGLALLAAGIGDRELTFRLLDQAYQEGSVLMVYLEHDQYLDEIRSDSRFQALVSRVNFRGRSVRDDSAAQRAAVDLPKGRAK